MRHFHCSCQGAGHIATDKECQDYSCSCYDPTTQATIAIVSDGHGGDAYFRSAQGARFACEVTQHAILEFVADADAALWKDLPLIQEGTQNTIEKESVIGEMMRHLFAAIYVQWRQRIEEDVLCNPLPTPTDKAVKVYGCTLIAYVCTPAYWFAFQIGDGKCVMIDNQGECTQPIPWDEKCFLNQTTSLCDDEPIGEFRFCTAGDGSFPVAVFLGSDGIDDTFGDGDKLHNYYSTLLQHVMGDGEEVVLKELPESLSAYSQRGSQDDMSVACVYDETRSGEMTDVLTKQSLTRLQEQLDPLKENMEERLRKLNEADSRLHLLQKEYDRAKEQYEQVLHRIEQLQSQIFSSRS